MLIGKWDSFNLIVLIQNLEIPCGYVMQVSKQNFDTDLPHFQGKGHNHVEIRWGQRQWSCFPSERSRQAVFHGNYMMPINPFGITTTLWDDRCVLGSKQVGISQLHTSTIGRWTPWAVVLEVCWWWCKLWSIRWVVYFDKKYCLHL